MVASATYPRRFALPKGIIVLALAILLATIALPMVEHGIHAVNRHADEALDIRKCLEKNGPQLVFRQRDGSFLLFCQLPDGRWGMQAVKRAAEDAKKWVERTAFVKADGSWAEVSKWLARIGATRWKGPLP